MKTLWLPLGLAIVGAGASCNENSGSSEASCARTVCPVVCDEKTEDCGECGGRQCPDSFYECEADSDCVLTDQLCCRDGTTSTDFFVVNAESKAEYESYREKECFSPGGAYYGDRNTCYAIRPDCPLPKVTCADGRCQQGSSQPYADCASKGNDSGEDAGNDGGTD